MPLFLQPGQLPATKTNDSAAAGNAGELVETIVLVGSAVGLTTNTPANMCSISLTAGDWDVSGILGLNIGGTTSITYAIGSISSTSATLDTSGGRVSSWSWGAGQVVASQGNNLSNPPTRFSLSATTTIYFVAQAGFTVSTCSVFGNLRARRIR